MWTNSTPPAPQYLKEIQYNYTRNGAVRPYAQQTCHLLFGHYPMVWVSHFTPCQTVFGHLQRPLLERNKHEKGIPTDVWKEMLCFVRPNFQSAHVFNQGTFRCPSNTWIRSDSCHAVSLLSGPDRNHHVST